MASPERRILRRAFATALVLCIISKPEQCSGFQVVTSRVAPQQQQQRQRASLFPGSLLSSSRSLSLQQQQQQSSISLMASADDDAEEATEKKADSSTSSSSSDEDTTPIVEKQKKKNDAVEKDNTFKNTLLLTVPLFFKFVIVLAIKFLTDLVVLPLLLLYRAARRTKRRILKLFARNNDNDSEGKNGDVNGSSSSGSSPL